MRAVVLTLLILSTVAAPPAAAFTRTVCVDTDDGVYIAPRCDSIWRVVEKLKERACEELGERGVGCDGSWQD